MFCKLQRPFCAGGHCSEAHDAGSVLDLVRRANRKLLALKHPQPRRQRFSSLNRALEDAAGCGFSEQRLAFASLCDHLPSGLRGFSSKLVCQPLPGLQPPVPAAARVSCALTLCPARRTAQPPRPFMTWPQATFPPTPRISGSSSAERGLHPAPPTGHAQHVDLHVYSSHSG